ncbi:MAG: ATP synthase F1 subunit delta [Nitrospirota bacterium]|nr:ATP synthase F1 subunit delta [Nitrospirota bacterium]
MSDLVLARRYARAFLEVAEKDGKAEAVLADLEGFASLLGEAKNLRAVFSNPSFTAAERGKVLGGVLDKASLSPLSRQIIEYLLAKGRLLITGDICAAYRALLDERSGRKQAKVVSAVALGNEQMKALEAKLSSVVGGKVEVSVETDTALIGGLVVSMGGTVYDGSIRSQLDKLKTALL